MDASIVPSNTSKVSSTQVVSRKKIPWGRIIAGIVSVIILGGLIWIMVAQSKHNPFEPPSPPGPSPQPQPEPSPSPSPGPSPDPDPSPSPSPSPGPPSPSPPISSISSGQYTIQNGSSQCLQSKTVNGNHAVLFGTCESGTANQFWDYDSNAKTLKYSSYGSSDPQCLSVNPQSSVVFMDSCNHPGSMGFNISPSGIIQHVSSGKCLGGVTTTPSLVACSDPSAQGFTFPVSPKTRWTCS